MDRESVTLTVPRWSKRRRTLVGIDMFVTATAIAGGVLLVTGREDERFPREILARTPFDNFTVPGWLLGAGVGGSAAISTIAASASPHGTRASVPAGAIMMAWIIAEAALAVQPRATAIEGLYFGLGAAMVGLACSLDDRFLEHGVSLTAEAGGECP